MNNQNPHDVLLPALYGEGYWVEYSMGDRERECNLAHQIYLGHIEVAESAIEGTVLVKATKKALDKYWMIWY